MRQHTWGSLNLRLPFLLSPGFTPRVQQCIARKIEDLWGNPAHRVTADRRNRYSCLRGLGVLALHEIRLGWYNDRRSNIPHSETRARECAYGLNTRDSRRSGWRGRVAKSTVTNVVTCADGSSLSPPPLLSSGCTSDVACYLVCLRVAVSLWSSSS